MPDDQKRLGDDRRGVGEDFERAQPPRDRDLARSFEQHQSGRVETVGDQFADPGLRDRRALGNSFADPNFLDDQKLGNAFEQTNSNGRRKRQEHPKRPKPPHNYRVLGWLAAGALVVFLLIFFIGYLPRHRRNKENQERADRQRNATPVVEVEQVKAGTSDGGIVIPGTTTPLTEAFIYARASGYLQRRLVDIGDRVRKGQLLAVIDSPDLDQQVDQAREQVRQAEAQKAQQETQLALTRITVERYRVLVAKGVFSRQEGDQRETEYRAQVANVAASERNVEAFKANLRRVLALQSYERVTAPFDGVVTQRNADIGALISTGGSASSGSGPSPAQSSGTSGLSQANNAGSSGNTSTAASPGNAGSQGGPLFAIAQVNRLRVLVSVPDGYAGSITTGKPATLHFQEFPQAVFHGNVTRTSNSIDQNTRTLLTEVMVDNRDGKLLTGMYAVVTFPSPGGQSPLTIPGDAVAVRQDRTVVAVVKDGTVHLRPVVLGRDFGPSVQVVSGLEQGDLIATTFTDDVRDGARVEAKPAQNSADKGGSSIPVQQNLPPGGSSRYGDLSITNQDMQGQSGQGQQKGKGDNQKQRSDTRSKQ